MSQLPDALAPWAEVLVGLDPEMVGPLGEPLRKLSRWVGPPASPRASPTGEPDGFAGIGRRGAWERLLLSEWAVAQVAPLEFLRRAVAGEQATLQLRFVDPAASTRCVVLLDAPPSQHGAPRLAHLALLLVLAARAARGGLPLHWGLLQGGHLADDVGVDALEAWRHGARWGAGTEADLDRWLSELALDRDDELWLIGGPELPQAPDRPGVRALVVDEPLRADGKLSVRWGSRQLWLDPVPVREGTQLFRRPPRPRPPRRRRAVGAHSGRLWFGIGGDRLFVPCDDGSVVAYHVPNSPAAASKGPGRPRVVPGPGLMAAGYHRRRMLSVRLEHDYLVVRPGEVEVPIPIDFVRPEGVVLAVHESGEVCMVDGIGQLWRFPSSKVVARGVLAFDRYQLIIDGDDGPAHRRWWSGNEGPELPVPYVQDARVSDHGVALKTAPTTWWLESPVTVPEGAVVAGPIYLDGTRGLLYGHEGKVWFTTAERQRLVQTTPGLVDLAVHPTRPIYAWCTDTGRIVARHAPDDTELLRVASPLEIS